MLVWGHIFIISFLGFVYFLLEKSIFHQNRNMSIWSQFHYVSAYTLCVYVCTFTSFYLWAVKLFFLGLGWYFDFLCVFLCFKITCND